MIDITELKSTSEVSEICPNPDENLGSITWNHHFPGFRSLVHFELNLNWNRMIFEMDSSDDSLSILKALEGGVAVVGVDMNRNSLLEVKRLFRDMEKSYKLLRDSLETVKYIVISPRFPKTGFLKNNILQYDLQIDDEVLITSDRYYSTKCTNKIIYVNSKFCIGNLKKCDVIQVGNIRMRVLKSSDSTAECIVVFAGTLKSESKVVFPSECDQFKISLEEIEDFEFARNFDIDVIVTPYPGCDGYFSTLQNQVSKSTRIFSKIRLSNLQDKENQDWIVNCYDGFFIDLEFLKAGKRFIKMDEKVSNFLKRCYSLKKPVILSGFCKESFIDEIDADLFYFYPDKYMIQKEHKAYKVSHLESFLTLSKFNAGKYAIHHFNHFEDTSTTSSDTFAISVASMSYTIRADVIILWSFSGRMAMKISHFRPFCPIIAYVRCNQQRKFISMCFNILTIPEIERAKIEEDSAEDLSKKEDNGLTPFKLMKAFEFCRKKQFIMNGSEILIVFRSKIDRGYQNKFVNIPYKENCCESEFEDILK